MRGRGVAIKRRFLDEPHADFIQRAGHERIQILGTLGHLMKMLFEVTLKTMSLI